MVTHLTGVVLFICGAEEELDDELHDDDDDDEEEEDENLADLLAEFLPEEEGDDDMD